MNKKIIFLLCACLCLVSCDKKEKGQESQEVTKNVIEIDTTKQMAEKMTLDDSGGADIVFENLSFEDKDMDQVMDFFKDYGVQFEKSDTYIRDFVADAKNNIYDGGEFGYDWTPETSYEGSYVFDNRMNLIATNLEDGKMTVEVYTKDKDKEVEKNTILDNISNLETYIYDDDKLYYGADTLDGNSILGYFSLGDFQNESLVVNPIKLDGGNATGDVITLVTKLDDDVVYQVSHYENQVLGEDKPLKNKLVYLNNPNKEVDLGENSFDVIEKYGDYIICHDKTYGTDEKYVKIYDKDFRLLYKTEEPMDRLVNVTKLEKDGKTYLLLSDGLWTHYIVDVEENKNSYQLNGINAKDRYFFYSDDKFVISNDHESYIGKVRK
ncbi:hypothetical protein [uncultured Anaerococcus sp.]|uniref:hypothetical protein n=1 Tax=uncultured Anaerococcus sp. TaxID=293428 RepID=UPI002889E5BF|nr:hypothetical protein [uncultured Anaerococcus sp.]